MRPTTNSNSTKMLFYNTDPHSIVFPHWHFKLAHSAPELIQDEVLEKYPMVLMTITTAGATATTTEAPAASIKIRRSMLTGIRYRSPGHVMFTPNSARASAALEASFPFDYPALFLFAVLVHADFRVENTTSSVLVDGVLHSLGEVFWESRRIVVNSGHIGAVEIRC